MNQPYFLPYLGYFSLIKHADQFILFDTAQFIRHSWIERNRILKPVEGWQYIQVPLKKHPHDSIIGNIEISNDQNWKDKIAAQLRHYKKTAPYYNDVISLLKEIFLDEYDEIVGLNKALIKNVCSYIGFEANIKVFSEMNLDIEPVSMPDEWALNVCKAINGAVEYRNLPGGMSFYDRRKYEKNNIFLKFQRVNLTEYDQKRPNFEPGLSIIDVMMFNSKGEINHMLDNYDLL
jgi:hypothetical protein